MTKEEFLEILTEELEVEDVKLEEATVLSSLDEWDSMAVMVVVANAGEQRGHAHMSYAWQVRLEGFKQA